MTKQTLKNENSIKATLKNVNKASDKFKDVGIKAKLAAVNITNVLEKLPKENGDNEANNKSRFDNNK